MDYAKEIRAELKKKNVFSIYSLYPRLKIIPFTFTEAYKYSISAKPEFSNSSITIPYTMLSDEILEQILEAVKKSE